PRVPQLPSSHPRDDAPALTHSSSARLELREGWSLQASPRVAANGEQLSLPGYVTTDWYPISVPSTVLAGLVKNGVYPDPFVLNNLAAIARRDFAEPYWYRNEFELPAEFAGPATWLRLDGINYRADVWLN